MSRKKIGVQIEVKPTIPQPILDVIEYMANQNKKTLDDQVSEALEYWAVRIVDSSYVDVPRSLRLATKPYSPFA